MLIQDAYNFIRQIDLAGALMVFWFFFVFDLPRYTLSTFAVLLAPRSRGELEGKWSYPISVLLVGHNEADKIARNVLSLREQTRRDLEIVVVDDGSTDRTREVGYDLRKRGLISRFVCTGVRGGKASALNIGARYCRHEAVVVLDADTSLDRDAIDRLVAPLCDPSVGAVAGNLGVRNYDASVLTAFQGLQYFFSIGVGRRFRAPLDLLLIISGAVGAYRASALRGVGGWDVGPGDDSNATTKVRRAGWRIEFAHDAWALTDVPDTLQGYLNQQMRWNRSLIRNRVRKFRSIFNPFQANFSMADAVATANLIFFQVILAVSFFAYIIWLFYWLGSGAFVIILIMTILYLIEDVFMMCAVCILYWDRNPTVLLPHLPVFTLYKGYFLRSLRLLAYTSELIFRSSYRDQFYPEKVRTKVEKF